MDARLLEYNSIRAYMYRVNVLEHIDGIHVYSSIKTTLHYFFQLRENGPGWDTISTSFHLDHDYVIWMLDCLNITRYEHTCIESMFWSILTEYTSILRSKPLYITSSNFEKMVQNGTRSQLLH